MPLICGADLLWLLWPTIFHGKFCQIPRAGLQNSAAYRGKIFHIPRLTVAFYLQVNYSKTLVFEGLAGIPGSDIVLSYASKVWKKLLYLSFYSF